MGKWNWFRFSKKHNVKIETDDKDFNAKWFIDCGLNGENKAERICQCVNACLNLDNPETDVAKLIETLKYLKSKCLPIYMTKVINEALNLYKE